MSPRSPGPNSKKQLQIEALTVGASAAQSNGRAVSGRRPVRQAARRESSTDRGASDPSGRTSRTSGRPVQPVPRLLLSRKEAAASLGMSVDTFERRVQPVIKVVPCGQLVLVPLRELERWCDDHAHYMAGVA